MIIGLWHTSFTVENLDKSIPFYRDLLGLTLVHEQAQNNEYTRKLVGYPDANLKVAMFSIDGLDVGPSGHVLELVEYVSPKGLEVPEGTVHTRSAHLAFRVTDIFQTVHRLTEHGVAFKSEIVAIQEGRNKGGYTVYFKDPDGITLELVQPPSKERV
ncbi:VOC family protein [Sporosarcina sp. FSL W7-1349]|uniref:VOC family protein n=1 Tax=Sporosarcina sp. FSL W7-1349 TaxID=2921561 RepID=UPI0030FA6409